MREEVLKSLEQTNRHFSSDNKNDMSK
jgi:hypothetical protein